MSDSAVYWVDECAKLQTELEEKDKRIAELEAKFSEKYWDEVGVEMLQLKEVIQRMHESVERWNLGLIDEQDCLDLLCKGLKALLPENQHE